MPEGDWEMRGSPTGDDFPVPLAPGAKRVTAAEAQVVEATFVRLVENLLQALDAVPDPLHQVDVPVRDWSQEARPIERPAGLVPGPGPTSAGLIFDLNTRNWLGKVRGRVVVEVRSLAHRGRLAAEGFDDRPITRLELESLLNDAAHRAAQEDTWHLLIFGSPTGWSPDAHQLATGTGPLPFSDRRVSVVLFDAASGHFGWSELDEKVLPLREVFSGDVDADTLQRARQFLAKHLALYQSLGVDTLVTNLGINPNAALRVMRLLAAEGGLHLTAADDIGLVLVSPD
jgi:hypothetical protein